MYNTVLHILAGIGVGFLIMCTFIAIEAWCERGGMLEMKAINTHRVLLASHRWREKQQKGK